MATVRPRVQVCLDAETKAVYDDLADAFGISTSRMIANVLADCAPSMIKVSKAMKMAKNNNDALTLLNYGKELAVEFRQEVADAQVDIEDMIAVTKKKAPKPK